MSTRGIIAIEDPDKTCRAVYVHFDMYPGFPPTHNEECHCGGMTSNAA